MESPGLLASFAFVFPTQRTNRYTHGRTDPFVIFSTTWYCESESEWHTTLFPLAGTFLDTFVSVHDFEFWFFAMKSAVPKFFRAVQNACAATVSFVTFGASLEYHGFYIFIDITVILSMDSGAAIQGIAQILFTAFDF